jgi:hypothetical protein
VLPLALSTAAAGLFQQDHLALPLPAINPINPPDRKETVLVWGVSTSVGSNAIQLARCAGYRVLATASPHNSGYVRSLGAPAAASTPDRQPTTSAMWADGRRPALLLIPSPRGRACFQHRLQLTHLGRGELAWAIERRAGASSTCRNSDGVGSGRDGGQAGIIRGSGQPVAVSGKAV